MLTSVCRRWLVLGISTRLKTVWKVEGQRQCVVGGPIYISLCQLEVCGQDQCMGPHYSLVHKTAAQVGDK